MKRKRVPIDKDDHPPADEQSKTKAQNCIMIVGAAGTSLQFAILISLRILVIHCSLDVKVVCENFITTAHQHDDDAERSASKPYLRCVQFKLFFFSFPSTKEKTKLFLILNLKSACSQSEVQIEIGLIASDETIYFLSNCNCIRISVVCIVLISFSSRLLLCRREGHWQQLLLVANSSLAVLILQRNLIGEKKMWTFAM